MIFSILITAAVAVAAAPGFAGSVENGPKKIQVFENADCEANESCALRRFSIEVNDYVVHFSDGDNFGTRMAASYETTSVSSLEDFVIVQFIRGCQFYSKRVGAKVEKTAAIVRQFYGDPFWRFMHPAWVIDSIDTDPVYWSSADSGHGRHHVYAWNKNPRSTEPTGQHRYGTGAEKPPFPRLYVTDLPGSAFVYGNQARNISLEFRTCIYKTRDVPVTVAFDDTEFARPIQCFEWASSFLYNHVTNAYESRAAIDPFCFKGTGGLLQE